MTVKLIELQVEIPDSRPEVTSEWLVEAISNELIVMTDQFKLPRITEIKVTRTMPPPYDTKNYADKPTPPSADVTEQHEESFNTTIL